MDNLIHKLDQLARTEFDNLHTIAAVKVEEFVQQNFDQEGFSNANVEKWAKVKRKKKTKILYDTGVLSRTLKFRKVTGGILVTSHTAYAKIHNEGGFAGRNKSAYIQMRKYVGESPKLNNMLEKAFTIHIKSKLNGI